MVAKSPKPGSACDAALFAADFPEYRGERDRRFQNAESSSDADEESGFV